MEGFSRDLLCGIGKGDAPPPEQRPGPLQVEVEEVELSLGLSLGGRFGVDRKGEKLSRSSSVAAVMTTPAEVVAAPPALPRASSLPLQAESSEVGKKQGLDGWGSRPEAGGLGVEHVARLPASGSPSSASSEGEAQKLQGTLIRTSSLPADVEAAGTEESNKRRIAESLKRLLKKKRVDRTSSLTCSASREAAVQTVEEMNARSEPTEKLVSCDETVERNNENCSSGKQLMKGLPSKYQATTITSEDSSSAARQKLNNALREFLGIPNAEHSSSSSVLSRGVAVTSATAASPPCSSLVAAARANSMGDMERRMMQEMPGVFTKGLPNGNRVEGFLYKYRNGEQVRIVCICHGSFLTPSEFVEHAGAGKVEHPLRHIVVSSSPVL